MWVMALQCTSTLTPDVLLGFDTTSPPTADIHMVVDNLHVRAISASEALAYVVAILQHWILQIFLGFVAFAA